MGNSTSTNPRQIAKRICRGYQLVTFGAFPILISHFGNYKPPRASVLEPQRPAYTRSFALERPAPQAADDAEEKTTAPGQPIMAATRLGPGDSKPSDLQSNALLLLGGLRFPQPQAPQPPDAASPMIGTVAEEVKLDAAERQRVIDGVIGNLKQHYIDPYVAQKMAEALLAHEKAGDYYSITDGAAFATLLTRQLRDVSHDIHLEVVYSQTPLPDRPTGPTPERLARYRKAMEENNYTFEKVEIDPAVQYRLPEAQLLSRAFHITGFRKSPRYAAVVLTSLSIQKGITALHPGPFSH